MMAPLLLDLSHTSHTRARTGIQRVARAMRTAMGASAVEITFDPYLDGWRTLQPWEIQNLEATVPGGTRGARWPVGARLRGYAGRLSTRSSPHVPAGARGLVVPELFSPAAAAAFPALSAFVDGAKVALFHDAIALKLPEMTPPGTVARFPAYLRELLVFDGIAAVSEDSRQALLDYWRWLGAGNQPQVVTLPLGIDALRPPAGRPSLPADDTPVILCVGSIEGRKNHLSLLKAAEQLWLRGARFRLHLIGVGRPETAQAALERIAALKAAGRALTHDAAADDDALAAAYARSAFTVYPSLSEGFGLPVLESLAHGKPCICSRSGALGEAAREGGCLALEEVTTPRLAAAIEHLLSRTDELQRLGSEARARRFRTWSDYIADLNAWMTTLEPANR